MAVEKTISIGTLAGRTGLAVSAIRFYQEQGLVFPERNAGGQRRFLRSDIRRLSFVMIAQKMGFTLDEIRSRLDQLPQRRTPTVTDWEKMSSGFRSKLEARITSLTRMRDLLDGCIGCGCLSLSTCALYNPADRAAKNGQGPRYLLGDYAET